MTIYAINSYGFFVARLCASPNSVGSKVGFRVLGSRSGGTTVVVRVPTTTERKVLLLSSIVTAQTAQHLSHDQRFLLLDNRSSQQWLRSVRIFTGQADYTALDSYHFTGSGISPSGVDPTPSSLGVGAAPPRSPMRGEPRNSPLARKSLRQLDAS
ncbi:uncharacterized protein K452DRAFT_33867 [Aplosporella prunicola CBS 121167]|uniref:Uncharacterized protein n=1 Tax=Aplosporella prunicola CBS 121167 TaxID=1176127 RepID=A0A6A6BC63_9PEZI|nr:uncharacterized protein K452DRAFT_33867 [Aplosporella prunicola CBS 121167]KAF2141799.1 hypothetical protein K452DRAFT_33867 [Aplosporella prunicola CBS 121167]